MGFRHWLSENYWQEMLLEAASITAALKGVVNKEDISRVSVYPYTHLSEEEKLILKKWLIYQDKIRHQPVRLDDQLHVLAGDKSIFKKLNNPDYTWEDLLRDNRAYHAQLKNKTRKEFHPKEQFKHLNPRLELNGLEWVSLRKDYDQDYGNSMGHCGNVARMEGDNIWSLYDPNTHIHYLTFIVNNYCLGEAKGRNNAKPEPKFYPNIKQLLLAKDDGKPIIETIKGGGYAPERNFCFEDLSPEDQKEIQAVKPNIDDFVSYYNQVNGQDKKFCEYQRHLYVSKRISNEEFEELGEWLQKKLFVNTAQDRIINADLGGEYIRRGYDVPPAILDRCAARPQVAYYLAAYHMRGKAVPEEILDSMAENPDICSEYAGAVLRGKNIPEIIFKTFINKPNPCMNFCELMHYQNLPKGTITSVRNWGQQYAFVSGALREGIPLKDIEPELVAEACEGSPETALVIATFAHFIDLPKRLLQTIGSDSYSSLQFVERSKIYYPPQEILEGIAKDPYKATSYAGWLGYRHVPEVIINSVAMSKDASKAYALSTVAHYAQGAIAPDKILTVACQDITIAYKMIERMGCHAPAPCFQAIAAFDTRLSLKVAWLLHYENVPKVIVDKIVSDHKCAMLYRSKANIPNMEFNGGIK